MKTDRPASGLTVVGVTVAAILLVTAVAAVLAFLQQQHIAEITSALEQERSRSASLAASASELGQRIDSLKKALEASVPAIPPQLHGATPPAGAEEPTRPAGVARHVGFITRIDTTAEPHRLTIDYAELLTGEAADSAHRADGLGAIEGELFYLRNRNPKLRTFPVAEGVVVIMSTWEIETDGVAEQPVRWADWVEVMPGGSRANLRLSEAPYWITIKDGQIIRIAEQYLP